MDSKENSMKKCAPIGIVGLSESSSRLAKRLSQRNHRVYAFSADADLCAELLESGVLAGVSGDTELLDKVPLFIFDMTPSRITEWLDEFAGFTPYDAVFTDLQVSSPADCYKWNMNLTGEREYVRFERTKEKPGIKVLSLPETGIRAKMVLYELGPVLCGKDKEKPVSD